MKTKIEIKSLLGQILFEYEKEDNTIKDTLEEAVRQGADLGCADLCDTNLRGAYLSRADLCCVDLCGADLGGANLVGAKLGRTDLRYADLCGANLCYVDLRCADLCGADLGRADLRGANLRGADLRGTNLGGAYLRGAYLRGANLGCWGNLTDGSDILIVGAIGSRNSYTTIYHTDKGVFVQCGCFRGTLEEFAAKVKETHKGTKHERDYLALVEFAKIKFGV